MRDIITQIVSDPDFLEGSAWNQREFQANELIICAGEENKKLFFIEEGNLRVTVQVELERRKNMRPGICDLKAGDIFGETSLLGPRASNASVTAITHARAIEIEADKLNAYLNCNSGRGYLFFKTLFAIMAERVQSGNHRIQSLLAWGLRAHGIEQHL